MVTAWDFSGACRTLTAVFRMTGLGPVHLLEAIRIVNLKIRFYQARPRRCSARFRRFRMTNPTPSIRTAPYGVAKLYAHLDDGQLPRELRHFCSVADARLAPGGIWEWARALLQKTGITNFFTTFENHGWLAIQSTG